MRRSRTCRYARCLIPTRPPLRMPVARDLRLDSRAFGRGQRPVARPVGRDVGLLVRGAAVIALAEVLDHQLPVAFVRDRPARRDFQVRRLVFLQRRREIPDPRVEVRRVVRERDEDEPAQHLQGHRVQPVLRLIEAVRCARRQVGQRPVRAVGPRVIRAAEHRRVAARSQLHHREIRMGRLAVLLRSRRQQLVADAHPRPAMAAHVVERLHLVVLVADDDDAVAAPVLVGEVVARLRDAAVMVDHEPEMVLQELLVVRIVFLVDVILLGNRRPLDPPIRIGRFRLAGRRQRVRQHGDVAAVQVEPAVIEVGRHRGAHPFRDRGAAPAAADPAAAVVVSGASSLPSSAAGTVAAAAAPATATEVRAKSRRLTFLLIRSSIGFQRRSRGSRPTST